MLGGHNSSPVPMDRVIAKELEVLGSHGMQAHAYADLLRMIAKGLLAPHKLIGKRINLDDAADALMDMDSFNGVGITVIDQL